LSATGRDDEEDVGIGAKVVEKYSFSGRGAVAVLCHLAGGNADHSKKIASGDELYTSGLSRRQ